MSKLKDLKHRPSYLISISGLLLGLFSLNVASQSSAFCFEQASTALEKTFCEIKKAGGARSVKSINDFKKNPEKTQYLLLKRDAERLGIALPKTQVKTTQTQKKDNPKPEISTRQETPQHTPSSARNRAKREIPRASSLDACSLKKTYIDCSHTRYTIVGNLNNKQIDTRVFSDANQLLLPHKQNAEFQDQSDTRYLSDIYPIYIHKMLDLGLGDSTMSFTKFANVYWQNKQDGLDFVERFKFVYDKLKIEKRSNQIKPRYGDHYPNSIQQCMRLDSKIIVCDDLKKNWVYRIQAN